MAFLFSLLIIVAVIAFLVYLLYIPLPNEMAGRWHLQYIEPILRLTHEYPVKVITKISAKAVTNSALFCFFNVDQNFKKSCNFTSFGQYFSTLYHLDAV